MVYSQTSFIATWEGPPLQPPADHSCLLAHEHCRALPHLFFCFLVDWLGVSHMPSPRWIERAEEGGIYCLTRKSRFITSGSCDKRGLTVHIYTKTFQSYNIYRINIGGLCLK